MAINQLQRLNIGGLYLQGVSIREISKKTHFTPPTINLAVKKLKLPMRGSPIKRKENIKIL